MTGLIEGIAGGLVGRLTAKILCADAGDQPSFSEILAARMNASDSDDVDSLAESLSDLPITSEEARSLAKRIIQFINDLKASGGRNAQAKLNAFASRVSESLTLSQSDAARFGGIARAYAKRELSPGLPV